MATTYQPIANSTYLDYAAYGITSAPTVESAYGIADGEISPNGINVALVLPRVTDPSGFLAQDWGTRQQMLQELNAKGTLWSTYGASQSQYDMLVGQLESAPFDLEVLHDSPASGNYVSSAASRTIWLNIATAADFQALFDTTLMYSPSQELIYWNGGLSLPVGWNIDGVWIDFNVNQPPATNLSAASPVTLAPGAQSPGNDSASAQINQDPQFIAGLYRFPLDGETVQTGTIGLIEPLIGSALPSTQTESFQGLLTDYLTTIGRSGTGSVFVQGEDGQQYNAEYSSERSLDVGVVAAVNPNSDIGLYVGSGVNGDAAASVFPAAQSAIWDTVTAAGNTTARAAVTSSSYGDDNSLSPGSPFYRAYTQLFMDAVFANQTTFLALGDGGSGYETANGLPNILDNNAKPWNVMVGGTSLSTTGVAEADPTLDSIVASAMAGDPETIWRLVAGGLGALPSNAASAQSFVETIWNAYYVTDENGQLEITNLPNYGFPAGYLFNSAGSGGVDTTQATPSYQVDFGLHPVTSDPSRQPGRGTPDVSADSAGNLNYIVPNGDMVGTTPLGGTSAASPLWASLAIQINAIFADQNLPNLGYMNDLLYTAAAIAPASFNDITLGNNTSSFFEPGKYQTIDPDGGPNATVDVSPTGYGYAAGWGYDLVSGLGTPNGVLLARALTAIAHSEMSFDDHVPQVLDSYGAGSWKSGADQSLLIQTVSPVAAIVEVTAGAGSLDLMSGATEAFAWTARFAGQAEQSDFDAGLVRLFDRYGQGAVGQVTVSQGDAFAVAINGTDAQSATAPLTNQFGFVDFSADNALVRVARPVAVAETVNALDDQTAVVNIRQNGVDALQVSFYRVDDFIGSIGGLAPGAAGYEAAAQARAYRAAGGATAISGPGYGDYAQAILQDVDAGDIVAMKLVNETQNRIYWAFSQANEVVDGEHVGHIWNYGLNTWGFEDAYGGGDRDYNDLVVSLDFTSAFGHGWLV